MRKTAPKSKGREVLPEAPRADPRTSRPPAAPPPAPAASILPRVLGPLREGKGVRVGFLGKTGMGKTFGLSWLVGEARRWVGDTLIVDDKDPTTVYAGVQRVNPDDLRARPPRDDEDAGAVIYRGVAMDPHRSVDVDDVALQAWELAAAPTEAGQGSGVLLVVDELRRAVSPAGREWRAPAVARTLAEGRAPGISMFYGTQSPQRLPVEAFDNTDVLIMFKVGHRGRAYLERADLISPRTAELVAGLEQRQFIMLDDAGDWDGAVYEIPFRRR